uniref:Fibronectin type-III domain-containing protein n=1 Tax=Amphiprion ocellaris TaxID=80972 RepID=A0AAQ5WZI4_AMPOC
MQGANHDPSGAVQGSVSCSGTPGHELSRPGIEPVTRRPLYPLSHAVLIELESTQKVSRQNMKVRINATGDTIVMKFVRPNADTKLEGYILGYGSSMFSKQFIQLPENGQPYETEFDAEPKYLIAVQPIPTNEVKKHCTGKVELQKPLHLVIGSVTPTSVLLSWGTLLKTPYEGNIMNDCLEDGHYTVRYRERSRKWNYQTCPTSDTVIDNLKPNTVYEFGVQPNSKDGTGLWSKPVIHNISTSGVEGTFGSFVPQTYTTSRPKLQTQPQPQAAPQPIPQTKLQTQPQPQATPQPIPQTPPQPQTVLTKLQTQPQPQATPQPIPQTPPQPQTVQTKLQTQPQPQATPQPIPQTPPQPQTVQTKLQTQPQPQATSQPTLQTHPLLQSQPKPHPKSNHQTTPQFHSEPKPKPTFKTKQQTQPQLKPQPQPWVQLAHPRINQPTRQHIPHTQEKLLNTNTRPQTQSTNLPKTQTHLQPKAPRFDINENSSIFRPLPASDVDIMGKKRFVAPHVIYKTDKKPDEPCSITSSLAYFPDEEGGDQNVTGPPRIPPSNVTVVTVEGCPSFVILDWQKSDNETREYEVVSTTKGPNGQEVSILTTNQTHTAVENLKPESSYEFKVTPKNELGTGPSSDPVSFSTESADPRVSEYVSGKDAIWTQFPFKADAYSECSGKQYVKRTWYRKFVGIQLCNSLRYKIYLSDSLNGKFYNIGDQTGHGEDHCQFVDSFLDGRTGTQMLADQLPGRPGFYRALRQEPVSFGEIGGKSHVTYVGWYECGTPIPGKW